MSWIPSPFPACLLSHLRAEDIICTRIQGVYHRLTAPTTPNFAPRLKAEELEACATVWLGFRDGLDNLTRYQRLRVSSRGVKNAE